MAELQQKIFFRADGNAEIGLGHVVRSLALAAMLKEDYECHFIIREPLPALKKQILENCTSVIELQKAKNSVEEAKFLTDNYLDGSEIIVLDGYHFRTDYQLVLKQLGCKLVCIDDIFAYPFVADIIINHAGGVSEKMYTANPNTKFCLGLKYALLRPPFLKASKDRTYLKRNEEDIFICFGGADPNNDTLNVLKKCEQLENIGHCYVVVGKAYQFKDQLNFFTSKTTLKLTILNGLTAAEMVRLMKKCGMAITSPSTISFEYLSVGGVLFLKVIADNQRSIYQYFLKEGLAFDFDSDFGNISEDSKKLLYYQQEKTFKEDIKINYLKAFSQFSLS